MTTRATLLIDSMNLSPNDVNAQIANANAAKSKSVIIQQSAAMKDVVEQFQSRMQAVWVICDDSTVGMQTAFTSGANGILTKDPAALKDASSIYSSRTLLRKSFIIGHRGAPTYAPEDTMASYRLAVEKYGAAMIENDVWLTSDKQVIVMHDGTFTRTTDILTNTTIPSNVFTNGVTRNNCTPGNLTLAQVKMLDAGSWFNSSYAGERIPTLAEMFQYMQGKNVLLFLELKDTTQGIEQAVADLITQYHMENQVDVITFNTTSISKMETAASGIPVATLNSSTMPDASNPRLALRDLLNMILPMNAAYDSSYDHISDSGFINEANARGVQLFGWTYSDASSFAWAIDNGISGLTTNDVDWAQNYAFTLEPANKSYNLTVGNSIGVQANKITDSGQKTACNPDIVLLGGSDVIQVNGNTIKGLKAGTATIMMQTKSTMGDATYDIYTQPLTVTVETASSSSSTPSSSSTTTVSSKPSDSSAFSQSTGNIPSSSEKTTSVTSNKTGVQSPNTCDSGTPFYLLMIVMLNLAVLVVKFYSNWKLKGNHNR